MMTVAAVGVQAQSKLEQDLAELRTWMNRKISQGDSITRAEWPSIKQEFKIRTENLDRKSGDLSDKSEKEYNELKADYRAWEAERESSYGQPLSREEASRWEVELAGRKNLNRIRASQMRDVWVHFMEEVRTRRTDWSLRDWEYAEHVYNGLSDRKQAVLHDMSTGDKIKVAALQVEFNTLRKSRDAKDRYQQMRENR